MSQTQPSRIQSSLSSAKLIALALLPCGSPPGSPGRIAAYAARAALGLEVFNSHDRSFDDHDVLIGVFASNRELMNCHLGAVTCAGVRQTETAAELSEKPRPIRPSVTARKDTPEWRALEAERKRRERARHRRERAARA